MIRWLDDVLSVPQTVKAELFGVHDRTYQRWVSETEESSPAGDDERRIRLVAWLVPPARYPDRRRRGVAPAAQRRARRPPRST